MQRLLIVGGGVTGLAAARAGLDAGFAVTLLEASSGYGGKLVLGHVAGSTVDLGAESILARRPEGVALAKAVGLADDVVHPATTAAGVWSRGELHPLPSGQLMGVPGDLRALSASGVLGSRGLARVQADRVMPKTPVTEDVSVGEYVARRLGREVVDRLVEPLLGGVYAGHADKLSLRATVPQLASLAAAGTPLTTGVRELLAKGAPAEGEAPKPVFAGIRGGVGRLPGAIAADVTGRGADLRTDIAVRALRRTEDGWRAELSDGSFVDCDAVLLAVPAFVARDLIAEHAPSAAAELAGIEYASMAITTFAFHRSALTDVPLGSGFLVPPVDGRAIKAATFSSVKWPWLAHSAGDLVVLRASLGRAGEAEILEREDDELAKTALADLADATGLGSAPVDRHVQRWTDALPQYAVGHLDRVARIRAALPPGLAVAGAAYDGVGIPACIASAGTAVSTLTEGNEEK
ncbi:MAG TPA: protoporphyrinogen oxidase [Actinospica sp.]|nr:protoporphyrinogen oxidase [Actinospica sp.]